MILKVQLLPCGSDHPHPTPLTLHCSAGEDRAPLHAGAAVPCTPGWGCRERPGCRGAERALGGPGALSAAGVRALPAWAPAHLTVVLGAPGVSFQTPSYILGSCRGQRNEPQNVIKFIHLFQKENTVSDTM